MKRFVSFISEGLSIQYLRDSDVDVLKVKDTNQKSWVEIRGKKNYETKYDKNDSMHQTIDALGKAANISDLMNGEIVHINPKHPDSRKAMKYLRRMM